MIEWIIAAIVFFIIEIMTPGVFFFFCLAIGAIFGGLTTLVSASVIVQAVVFCAVSVISIYGIRPFLKNIMKHDYRPSNIDALLNKEAPVIEKIHPPKMGLIKIEGELWKAEAAEPIEADTMVKITGVKGNHLIVEKIK